MKSRIVDYRKQKILIYNFSPEREQLFEKTANDLNAELKIIPSGSASQTVGHLAGVAGYHETETSADADGECVIFADMDGKALERALDKMRANGLGGIPLKAAVTPHNLKMTLGELMDELAREHKKLHQKEN